MEGWCWLAARRRGGACCALAGLALLLQLPASAPAQLPPQGNAWLATHTRRVTAVELQGCHDLPADGVMRSRTALTIRDGVWTAPGPGDIHSVVSLADLGRGEPQGTLIDERGIAWLADAIADTYARAGRPGTSVETVGAAPTDEPGLLVLHVRESEPSLELERIARVEGPPARVAEISLRGVTGHWLSLAELRAIPLALARVPDGYVAAREGFPVLQRSLAEIERPRDLPIALYPSALQQILEAVTRTYRERGARGVRVYLPITALRRTLGSESNGVLEIHVVEP